MSEQLETMVTDLIRMVGQLHANQERMSEDIRLLTLEMKSMKDEMRDGFWNVNNRLERIDAQQVLTDKRINRQRNQIARVEEALEIDEQ